MPRHGPRAVGPRCVCPAPAAWWPSHHTGPTPLHTPLPTPLHPPTYPPPPTSPTHTAAGKTLAFLLPLVEALYRRRWSRLDGLGALVISPTRELALQVRAALQLLLLAVAPRLCRGRGCSWVLGRWTAESPRRSRARRRRCRSRLTMADLAGCRWLCGCSPPTLTHPKQILNELRKVPCTCVPCLPPTSNPPSPPPAQRPQQIFDELRKVGRRHDLSAGLLIGGKDVREEQARVHGEPAQPRGGAGAAAPGAGAGALAGHPCLPPS